MRSIFGAAPPFALVLDHHDEEILGAVGAQIARISEDPGTNASIPVETHLTRDVGEPRGRELPGLSWTTAWLSIAIQVGLLAGVVAGVQFLKSFVLGPIGSTA
jgi:hypothetical protein